MLEIVLNKISKNYGNKKILKNINFEIKTNEKVALIGQNGCGKTTIFTGKCLTATKVSSLSCSMTGRPMPTARSTSDTL